VDFTKEHLKKEAQAKAEMQEARIRAWGIDLEKLRAKAAKTAGKSKAGLDRASAKLRTRFTEAQSRLEGLKETGEGTSRRRLKGIRKAYAKLGKGIR